MPRAIEKFNQMTRDELNHQKHELTEQIFHLRFQLSTGQAEGVTRLRQSRKDLARVNTLLNAKHSGQAAAAPKAHAANSEGAAEAKHKAAPKAKAHKTEKKSAKATGKATGKAK
jgi:large subunit ribosomal protein L29